MDSMDFNKVLDQVTEMNERQLTVLADALNAQYRVIRERRARKAMAQLEVGSKVRISSGIKPKYLSGLTAKVTEINGSKVTVKLDCGPINKFRTGTVIFRSASALEVI